MKRIFFIIMAVLFMGILPGTKVWAGNTGAYTDLIPTGDEAEDLEAKQVTFNGTKWYIIKDSSTAVNVGTVTLLAADTSFGTFAFDSTEPYSNSYNGSDIKAKLDELTTSNGSFADVADAIQPVTLTTYKYKSSTEVAEITTDAKLYLLSVDEANFLPENVLKSDNSWWLRSPGSKPGRALLVYGEVGSVGEFGNDVFGTFGVRPALKLNLSKVIFKSESKTFSFVAKVGSTNYSKFSDALNAWTTGTTLTLLDDVTTSDTIIVSGTKTLDLNGYGIRYTGGDGSVIKVGYYGSNGNLTIKDSDKTRKHYITLDSYGRAISVGDTGPSQSTDTIKVSGGYITGGYVNYGAGIDVKDAGSLTLEGGTVCGNVAWSGGGGVYVNGSTFTLSGGSVRNNTSNSNGGGVYVSGENSVVDITTGIISDNKAANGGGMDVSGANVTMNGGKISNNESNGYGGGVRLGSNAKFTMKNGEISGNKATPSQGGGVFVEYASSEFTFKNGAISNNSAELAGGGVYIKNGSFTMNDGTITGNTSGSNSTSANGGGVSIFQSGKATLTGGSITKNSCLGSGSAGGGIYNDGTLIISGNPVVAGNTRGTGTNASEENVFMTKDITVGGTLSDGASIGVTKAKWDNTNRVYIPELGVIAVVADSYTLTESDVAKFKSDNSDYAVILKDGKAELVTGYKLSVKNGSGSGIYAEGATVTITANAAPSGQVFDKWTTTTEGLSFADATSAQTTFTMLGKAVEVTANYKSAPSPSGGGTDPTPAPAPTPDPEPAADIKPTADPSADKTPTGEPTESTDENGNKVTEQTNTDGSTTKVVESETGKTITVTEKDGTIKTQETTTDENGTKTESASVQSPDGSEETKTVQTFTDGSKVEESKETKANGDYTEKVVETTADGKTAESTSSLTTDAATGAKTEKQETSNLDGSTTAYEKVTQTNDDFVESFEEKDKTGTVIASSEASRETSASGTITEKSNTNNQDGSTESERVTEQSGDYTFNEVKKDTTGAITETTEASKVTEPNGDFAEKSETKDGNDSVLASSEHSRKTEADNSVTEKKAELRHDGTADSKEVNKDQSGKVNKVVVAETDSSGVTTEGNFEGKIDGSLAITQLSTTGTELVIPSTITGLSDEVFPVTEIGKDALKGQQIEKVIIPESVEKIDVGAFKDCGITEIHISGKVEKGMLAKNALAGNGTGKKGKGLSITVESKKDQKALKKQLKKAGAPKAKVKIQK